MSSDQLWKIVYLHKLVRINKVLSSNYTKCATIILKLFRRCKEKLKSLLNKLRKFRNYKKLKS